MNAGTKGWLGQLREPEPVQSFVLQQRSQEHTLNPDLGEAGWGAHTHTVWG